MAAFSNLSEDDYNNLNFPATPPPYREAMDLAKRFGSFSLDNDDMCCVQCGSGVERDRTFSMDEVDDGFARREEGKDDDEEPNDGDEGITDETYPCNASFAFSYEGSGYCNLDCFFKANKSKPGLCYYVDKLATVMLQFNNSKCNQHHGHHK